VRVLVLVGLAVGVRVGGMVQVGVSVNPGFVEVNVGGTVSVRVLVGGVAAVDVLVGVEVMVAEGWTAVKVGEAVAERVAVREWVGE